MTAHREAHGPICATDPCQLCCEARRRIEEALAQIEEAQGRLGDAMAKLSSLVGCMPEWNAANRVYNKVHALWYRVERKRASARFELDPTNAAAFIKREGLS